MIFKKHHIKQIEQGIKTQTRRVNRGVYQVGRDYAIQPGRGKKGIGMRIVMDAIICEEMESFMIKEGKRYPVEMLIWEEDAQAEGGYTPEEYEKEFRRLNPKWDGWRRWVFVFHLKKERDFKKLPFVKWRGGSFKAAKKAVEDDVERYNKGELK